MSADSETEASEDSVRETMKTKVDEADAAILVTIEDLEAEPTHTAVSAFVADAHEDMEPDPYKLLYERGTAHIAKHGGDASKYGVTSVLGGSFSSKRGYRPVDADLPREESTD